MSQPPAPDSPPATPRKGAAGLYTIIAIKFGKGLLLSLLSVGFFSVIGEDLQEQLNEWLRLINLNPEREFWMALGKHLQQITPQNLRWLASGSLLYALLLFLESIGLGRRSYWAVWLAIGETAFFIPLEIFDLVGKPSWLVSGILVVNSLIVVYLVRNRERLFHHHQRRHPDTRT